MEEIDSKRKKPTKAYNDKKAPDPVVTGRPSAGSKTI